MKISNSKKQLAKIIHENGGWRDGAEWAAQDKNPLEVGFWLASKKPNREPWPGGIWVGDGWSGSSNSIKCAGVQLVENWHQTVLSRDEYFHLYPAPDAETEQKAEIRWVRGKDIYATPTAHDCMEMLKEKLGSTECGCDECSAFYSKPAAHAESTIEQLAADYRNRKDYADRKQQEADAAKVDAEAKLAELVAAGKALGLVLSVADAPEPEPEPEPDARANGWVEYDGGGCPVDANEVVEVFLRKGRPSKDGPKAAHKWGWSIEDVGGDIIKWRRVKGDANA